jgi:hypothetical protein
VQELIWQQLWKKGSLYMFRSRRARLWSGLLLLPVLALLMGARQVPLVDPEPIAVPAGLTEAKVVRAIKAALVGRTWVVSEEQPGKIIATLNLRSHMAKIDISYDTSKVNIKYLDSRELMYGEKKGVTVIHRNYLSWLQNLVTDISRNLILAGD